jgi:hypothetical protein
MSGLNEEHHPLGNPNLSNGDCCPNVELVMLKDGTTTYRALRRIEVGEEILAD